MKHLPRTWFLCSFHLHNLIAVTLVFLHFHSDFCLTISLCSYCVWFLHLWRRKLLSLVINREPAQGVERCQFPGSSLNLKDFGVRVCLPACLPKRCKRNAALNLDRVLGMWPCRHLGEPQESKWSNTCSSWERMQTQPCWVLWDHWLREEESTAHINI